MNLDADTITVDVRASMGGTRKSATDCPVARAIGAAVPDARCVTVSRRGIVSWHIGPRETRDTFRQYELDPETQIRLVQFDNGAPLSDWTATLRRRLTPG